MYSIIAHRDIDEQSDYRTVSNSPRKIIYAEVCAEGHESLAAARRQYWGAKAEGETLRVGQQRGDLALVADFKAFMGARRVELRKNLDNLSARLASQLVGQSDRREVSRIIGVEVEALMVAWNRGGAYDDEAADAIVAERRGLCRDDRLGERSQKERGKSNYLKWDPMKQLYIDTETGTEIPESVINEYDRAKTQAWVAAMRGGKANDEKE